jgi:hypothetical protein
MPRHWEPGYKGPLPGNQLEFITPFAKKGMEAETTRESRVIAYCNEFVGLELGFILAPPRIGIFGENGTPSEEATNTGARYSKRANKGANQYKFLLRPGTSFLVKYTDPNTFAMAQTNMVKRSFSMSFDSTISVTEVKLWLCGAGATSMPVLMGNIYAFITPSLKVHAIGSKGDKDLRLQLTPEMSDHAAALGIKYVA